MSDSLGLDDFKNMIVSINAAISENADYLCELDSNVGDGDHGTTIARGLKAAAQAVEADQPDSPSQVFVKAGMAMMKSMGGASGPIFGSFFRGMGKAVEGKETIDLEAFSTMVAGGLQKVMDLGKAEPGQKTLVNSLHPAVEALSKACKEGADLVQGLDAMVVAAKAGAESTKEMVAGQGRARYSGERAIGHQDAGATSGYLILKAMKEAAC